MRVVAGGPMSLLIMLLLVSSAVRAAPGITVIVHDRLLAESLNPSSLARIYRRWQRIDDNGRPVAPVNLPVSDPVRQAFTWVLFRQSPEAMRGFWSESYFHGVFPPTVQDSREAVLRFVQRTPGAIGYLPDCWLVEGVVVAMHLDWPAGSKVATGSLCLPEVEGTNPDLGAEKSVGSATAGSSGIARP